MSDSGISFNINIAKTPDGKHGVAVTVYDDFGPEHPLVFVRQALFTVEQAEQTLRGMSTYIDEARQRNQPA